MPPGGDGDRYPALFGQELVGERLVDVDPLDRRRGTRGDPSPDKTSQNEDAHDPSA